MLVYTSICNKAAGVVRRSFTAMLEQIQHVYELSCTDGSERDVQWIPGKQCLQLHLQNAMLDSKIALCIKSVDKIKMRSEYLL